MVCIILAILSAKFICIKKLKNMEASNLVKVELVNCISVDDNVLYVPTIDMNNCAKAQSDKFKYPL